MLKFLDSWRCAHTSIARCAILLAEEFRARNFWKKADAILVRKWIEDLLDMSYEFPSIKDANEFSMSPRESHRGSNCRRAEMEFVSDRSRLKEALIITYNYPMNQTIGVLQRMYQPYFGVTIFCGPWYPEKYDDYSGYFVMADDNTFNFWHEIDLNMTLHPSGTGGAKALKKAVHLFEEKYRNDTAVQAVWDQYQDGISNKMIEANASVQLKAQDGWAVSDMYYVPSSLLEFHAGLMEIFFEARLFHEIAVSKFLYTVPHRLFCRTVLETFWSNLLDIRRNDIEDIRGSGNKTSMKIS
ncbi:hypothetical protein ANCCEY_09017 [Ancylostoma ceylanicum]|uniref:Uncharacterized protein n=1 Tax=Ancylostoma ceylanicum TaxID=53326 RepID=A0A0D6LW85_9BILA|nr:hypothetical protein ANCCEY_09017 [Ancylostoma ceylanicum]